MNGDLFTSWLHFLVPTERAEGSVKRSRCCQMSSLDDLCEKIVNWDVWLSLVAEQQLTICTCSFIIIAAHYLHSSIEEIRSFIIA